MFGASERENHYHSVTSVSRIGGSVANLSVDDRTLLDAILAPGGVQSLFQPIVELRGGQRTTFGHEGFVRGPKGTRLESPANLFRWAGERGLTELVDRVSVTSVLEGAARIPGDAALFLNVSASTLVSDVSFAAFLRTTAAGAGFPLSRVIVEIVGMSSRWENDYFFDALDALRQMHVPISLDDVGLGHSNYKTILDVRPDFLKVDRYFVDGCHADTRRLAVLASVADLGRRLGARAAVEGVEDQRDLEVMEFVDVSLFQGYLFAPATTVESLVASASK